MRCAGLLQGFMEILKGISGDCVLQRHCDQRQSGRRRTVPSCWTRSACAPGSRCRCSATLSSGIIYYTRPWPPGETNFNKIIEKGHGVRGCGGGQQPDLPVLIRNRLVTTQNIKLGAVRLRERLRGHGFGDCRLSGGFWDELVDNDIQTFHKLFLKGSGRSGISSPWGTLWCILCGKCWETGTSEWVPAAAAAGAV